MSFVAEVLKALHGYRATHGNEPEKIETSSFLYKKIHQELVIHGSFNAVQAGSLTYLYGFKLLEESGLIDALIVICGPHNGVGTPVFHHRVQLARSTAPAPQAQTALACVCGLPSCLHCYPAQCTCQGKPAYCAYCVAMGAQNPSLVPLGVPSTTTASGNVFSNVIPIKIGWTARRGAEVASGEIKYTLGKPIACECGAESIGYTCHSHWCPKGGP